MLGENTGRAPLYVAMTRGRDTNTGYLYERLAGEGEHEHAQPDGVHVARRGTSRDAAQLVRAIIATHDDQARTAHHIAAETPDREPACPTGCKGSSTAAPKPWPPGETTTRHGAVKPTTGSSIGN